MKSDSVSVLDVVPEPIYLLGLSMSIESLGERFRLGGQARDGIEAEDLTGTCMSSPSRVDHDRPSQEEAFPKKNYECAEASTSGPFRWEAEENTKVLATCTAPTAEPCDSVVERTSGPFKLDFEYDGST